MILVTGATGRIGRELVGQLNRAGVPVRGLARNPGPAKVLPTVEVFTGDLRVPDTLMPALYGVEQVFLLSNGQNRALLEGNMVKAAVAAGVTRIVKLSTLTVGRGTDIVTRWHEESERSVSASGLAWTFLRPGAFMSNALNWAGMIKHQGAVLAPFTGVRTAPIDPADIAAVAVAVLTQDGHEGKAYPLSGPQLISPAMQAELIATAIGHPVRVMDLPPETALERMIQSGMPAELAAAVLVTDETAGEGLGGQILPTVAELTGRAPASFSAWLDRHLDAFRY